jgi:NADPH2:quinone reductase
MGRLEKGERILIQGGTGGVGVALVQLAQWKGAEIVSTAGSSEKIQYLNDLGIEQAINYREKDFYTEAIQRFGHRSFDLVIDSVGGSTLKKGYELLASLGRIVSYGLSSAVAGKTKSWIQTSKAVWNTPSFKPLDLIQRNVGVYGFHLGLLKSKEAEVGKAFQQILQLFQQKQLEAVIAKEFPLNAAGAADAHSFMHERRNIGKVVLVGEL